MITDQFNLGIHRELFVDNFAGGGGASTGIERALGRAVDHAINHNAEALGMHRINHPQTIHHCEDVFEIDPLALTEGRPVGGAWFSPDCKHFSKAKGGKPLDKKIRGLVLVMLRWAASARPRVFFMENVEEIQTWGPLAPDFRPDPAHKGRTWQAFLSILGGGIEPGHPDLPEILEVLNEAGSGKQCEPGAGRMPEITAAMCVTGFGYHCETRELRACDYGAPTIRKRLFMVARCDGLPIVWPNPTHANPVAKGFRGAGLKKWRTIAECIDWDRPCPSIFLTREQARVARCKRPLVRATLRRVAHGIDRYVLKSKRPFIVNLTHGARTESVDAPANTITGANRGEKAVVAPTLSKFHGNRAKGGNDGSRRNQRVDEPVKTLDTANRFGLAQAELAPFITEHAQSSNQRNCPADAPLPTHCASVKGGHFAAVTGTVVGCGGRAAQSPPRPMDGPAGTGTAKADACLVTGTLVHCAHGEPRGRGAHDTSEPMPTVLGTKDLALAVATLVQTGYGERAGQAPRALDVEKPLGTIVSGGKHAVVTANLMVNTTGHSGSAADKPTPTVTGGGQQYLVTGTVVGAGGPAYSGKPIAVDRPFKAQTVENHSALAAASMVKLRGENIGHHPEEPGHTQSAGGTHHGVVAATFIAQHNAGFNETPGHGADEPASTISASGSQQNVVMGSLAAYYGNDEDGQAVTEPARTVTTRERFGLVESNGIKFMLTPEQLAGALRVAAFLREHGVQFEGEFATVQGYVIVDIGMRMLMPRELFRAQGFPGEYVIDRAWVIDPHTGDIKEVALTKEQQIRMCGNSVCPPLAEALVGANVPGMCLRTEARSQKPGARMGKRKFQSLEPKPWTV